jgi:hypothetical protein
VTSAHLLVLSDEFVIQFVFWAGLLAIVSISTFWPWWKTDLGWTICLEMLCLSTVTFPSTMFLEFGMDTQTLFWQWWVAITFFVSGCVTICRIFVTWRYQHYRKATERTSET